MANFRKSFNFRNGVQVDEDNFIVNSAGLVGIGTSVPTEFLDVRGSVKIVGVATIQDAFIGVATVQNKLEVGITSFSSGIITAKSGIVTYYGDARYLQGMPTSQWVDTDVGLGYTSIYAAGSVGVGTTDPRFTFQVGGNNDVSNFTSGVGINSSGDVKISGIVTAAKYYGYGIGVTGLSASDAIATGTLHNDRLPSNLNISGIVTSGSFVTGSITSSSLVTNQITSSGISITGVVTSTGGFIGDVVGTASTAQTITGTPDLQVGVVTATKIVTDNIEISAAGPGITTITKLLHVGTGGTAFSALESGRIGVGTAVPTASLQITESDVADVEILSETTESKITLGQGVGVGNSASIIRFGNATGTLELLNRDIGGINMYLHAGNAGINTGRFDWIYGQTNAELMSLTYEGKLGLGLVNPDHDLHVVGTSTVTGNSWVGGDLNVAGDINGTITLPDILSNNINTNTGVSTFNNVSVGNTLTSTAIGIGTSAVRSGFIFDAEQGDSIFRNVAINTTSVSENLNVGGFVAVNGIGINTTSSYLESGGVGEAQIHDASMRFYSSNLVIKNDSKIGFNTNNPRSVLDYGLVGTSSTNPYMIMPSTTTAAITGLGQTIEGAIIFNTTTKKHQGYGSTDGGSTFNWHDLY